MIEDVKRYIKEYTGYLNNGEWKPQWRIEEIESFLTVMNRVLAIKGIDNGKDGRTN